MQHSLPIPSRMAPLALMLAVAVVPAWSSLSAQPTAVPQPPSPVLASLDAHRVIPVPSNVSAAASPPFVFSSGTRIVVDGPADLRRMRANHSPDASLSVPAGRIVDAPRFTWRGSMLDVARHFFTVDEVKQHIDLMALYKLNRLHLHLADDQGWRIAIASWPRLTKVGGSTEVGGAPSGFYTKADYAEIVRYAAARHIMVVPEIDMPGHTNAAIAAYPRLGCSRPTPSIFGDGTQPAGVYTGIRVGWSALCPDKA
ncbi:MAG: hypothetical protein EBV77_09340, partial [Gemmatimonadaceae bacterium]|nr:hypothetical protein [Gemmatimonadaceae bacterium]